MKRHPTGWNLKWRMKYLANTKPIHTRIDIETHKEFVAYAKANRQSLGQTIREFIEWGLSRERDPH